MGARQLPREVLNPPLPDPLPHQRFLPPLARDLGRASDKPIAIGLAHVVPEKWVVKGTAFVFSQISNRNMGSRTGLESEAINRLTDGVQAPVMRAILVQCLAGDIAPSAAISQMLAEGPLSTVRAAIDDVTERAATISRASDMLVHDRVDELTQVFVENVAALADVSDATKISSAAKAARETRSARSLESGDRGEPRISG